uniref:Uncharacterized protein n=1 Tax=Panagrellus redivivus TaxID=6233 RepID=A0A7E4W7F6_PANRE
MTSADSDWHWLIATVFAILYTCLISSVGICAKKAKPTPAAAPPPKKPTTATDTKTSAAPPAGATADAAEADGHYEDVTVG